MESSDDESETVPLTVSNYHFVDEKDKPISFSELPVKWNEDERLDSKRKQIFLHGSADNGLQKIYTQVLGWKFDISDVKPEISVLSKGNNWIKLEKPRKSHEEIIRTILITMHCLHLMKKDPEISRRDLWDHLFKVFSSYDPRPSENDLIDHMALIREAFKRDITLAKSEFLVTFLEEKPQKKKMFEEDVETTVKAGFILDDDTVDEIDEGGSDEEDDLFDSVCSICDNGGDLLCCEGRCLRSFHATEDAGSESACDSLGYSDEQVKVIQNFFCKNCQYKQHQCFSCGELGSSDKSSGAEVFPCVSATCGHFYHPHCVAKLLHYENAAEAEKLQKKIAAGESFTCPIHKCYVCKQGENKMDTNLQFAVCRRCPKSYHRKCLPREVAFEDLEDEGLIQRAWEDLIPNRILIYCLHHEIDDEIGTPIRNHIKFPGGGQKKKKPASGQLSRKERIGPKDRSVVTEDPSRKTTLGKLQKQIWRSSSTDAENESLRKSVKRGSPLDNSKKQKVVDVSKKPLKTTASAKVNKSSTDGNGPSLGEKLYALVIKNSEGVRSRKEDMPDHEHKQTLSNKPVAKEKSSLLPLDADSERRILALAKDAASSVTLKEITEKHKVPITHAYSSKIAVDKGITLGKVEGSIEALREALQKLEGGCSVEDARAVCEPQLLNQITKWKNKLKVYLAPFLYGMRYTSFGRHFTKVEKLKEIVSVLHWYVQEGDTIVDFCCGANDFSCFMKKKLDEMGIKCFYKNYDVLQAKNDFNFERRDWMKVRPKELPAGSKLIMGLNPPFGVNAALANKFIDKALEFKPKLLILIVPRETERLDKKSPYDLVWEDDELLAGKSFYLPGSVDVNDNQMEDWNVNPPPLYLWSHPDWTAAHKTIAQQHGHLTRVREGKSRMVENQYETVGSEESVEDHDVKVQISMLIDGHTVENQVPGRLETRGLTASGSLDGGSSCDIPGEVHKTDSHHKRQSNGNSKKRRRNEEEDRRRSGEPSSDNREKGQSHPSSEMCEDAPRHSTPNLTGGRSLDSHSSKSFRAFPHPEVEEGYYRYDHIATGSHAHTPAGNGGAQADDIARYSLNREEPCSGANQSWSTGIRPSPGPDYVVRNPEEQFSGYGRETIGHNRPSPGPDYGVRNPEEQFSGYGREMTGHRPSPGPEEQFSGYGRETTGHRPSPGPEEQFSGYGRETTGHRPCLSVEDRYATREPALRSQIWLYGQQENDMFGLRSSYLAGEDPGFLPSYNQLGSQVPRFSSGYNHLGSFAMELPSSRVNTSTMQRYAPHLNELNHDELNHTRMSTLGPNLPPPAQNGIPDSLASRPGYRIDNFGFAPGPYPHFNPHNS